jgi:hypothetical protein
MRRVALLLVAVVVISGCRITSVFDTGINYAKGVERHPSGGVVTIACDVDAFPFGPGVVLVHPGGTSDSFVGCRTETMSAPGAAADGTIYVGVVEELPAEVSRILAIDPDTGVVATIADVPGVRVRSLTIGPAGDIYYGGQVGFGIQIYRLSGSTSVAQPGTNGLGEYDFALDASANVYASGGDQVAKVTPQGVRTIVAGTGTSGFSGDGGPATAAQLNVPAGVDVDPSGRVLIADRVNNRIRQVGVNGEITTVAGNGTIGFSGDGGLAISAELYAPDDVAFDTTGGFWIADTLNSRVRHVGLP